MPISDRAFTIMRWLVMFTSLALLFCRAARSQTQIEVIEFSSSNCLPCQQMRPVIAQLRTAGVAVKVYDVETDSAATRAQGIKLVPTIILRANGREVKRWEGLTSYATLSGEITRLTAGSSVPSVAPHAAVSPPGNSRTSALPNVTGRHTPVTANGIAPITRVQRLDKDRQVISHTMMTGVPIVQSDSEVLVVTAGHFAIGATTLDCSLGESGTVKGKVVATDPDNDLALIVGKVDGHKQRWELSTLAALDAKSGDVAAVGYPLGKPVRTATGHITGDGWCDIRFISGDSGGPVFQYQRVIGIISAATPSPTDLANPDFQRSLIAQPGFAGELATYPGSLQQKLIKYYEPLEQQRHLGKFVPVSKVHAFVGEAAQKLAFDYPVFTMLFKGD